MSIDRFLEQVKNRFSPETSRAIVSAFRHEPLVWKTLENNSIQTSFGDFAQDIIGLWQPGILAMYALAPEVASLNLSNLEISLPENLHVRAQKTLETIQLTGLEPSTLTDAGLLALTLREMRSGSKNWNGLTNFLTGSRKNLSIWRAAFACLPVLIPDFPAAVQELTTKASIDIVNEVTDLITHTVQCTPAIEDERLQSLLEYFGDSNRSFQVESLHLLESDESPQFIEKLASGYLIQNPIDLNANLSSNTTPSYGSVEELQKIAEISQIAGQPLQSQKAIQKAFESLNANQALVLSDMAAKLENNDSEEARKTWEQVLQLAPANSKYIKAYADFLFRNGDEEYGLELLNKLPDNEDIAMFSLRYPTLREILHLDSDKLKVLAQKPKSKTSDLANSPSTQAEDHLEAARFALDQKNYKLAQIFIEKALHDTPNDIETIKLAGIIQRRLADMDGAIESSSLVALFEPENMANKKELANLFLQTQQPQKAFEIYREIVDATPETSREDLLTYCDLAIKAGKPEVAIPISESFLTRDSFDGEALVILCNANIAKGDEQTAIGYLERTSAIAPEKPSSWLSLAQIWTSLGQTDKAIESLRKAQAALPEHPEILAALGKLYLDNDKPTEAVSVLKLANQIDPQNIPVRKGLAKAYLQHGYLNEAWSAVSSLESEYVSDPDLALVIGKIMHALGDIHSAKPILKFAWQSCRSDEALQAYAALLLQQQENEGKLSPVDVKELDLLLAAVAPKKSQQENAFIYQVLEADIKSAQANYPEAYQDYLTLLDQTESKAPRIYHHLQHQIGSTALKLGLNDIALASLQEAVMVNPDNLNTRHILAEAYIASGLVEEGLNSAKAALQLAPADLDNVLWYSNFTLHNQNEQESIQVLRDAIRLHPDERALYLTLARTHQTLGDTGESKQTLNKMLEVENITTEEYVNVANLYLHMNDSDEASQIIKRAISNNPNPDFEEARDLTYSILRLGDPASACHFLQEMESILGSHTCFPLLKADVLAANEQFIPALQALEPLLRQLEFDPDSLSLEMICPLDSTLDVFEYSKAGIYYRAAQLERMIGDLNAAQKHTNLGLGFAAENQKLLLLQAELAFAVQNSVKLDALLEHLHQSQMGNPGAADIAVILATDALVSENHEKFKLIRDHFLIKQPDSALELAFRTINAINEKNHPEIQAGLKSGQQLLSDTQTQSGQDSFYISKHFSWIWQAVIMGYLAWQAQDWDLADYCFNNAISKVQVNPVVNKLIAEYLIEKSRITHICRTLRVKKHAPRPFCQERDDESIYEEHVSLAGRFIASSEIVPTLKIGQAVFSGKWSHADTPSEFINTARQAAQLLSIEIDHDIAMNIKDAFPENEDVRFQEALGLLIKQPPACAELVESLVVENPENPLYHCVLALARQNEPEFAVQSLQNALEIWPDESDWFAIAGSLYEQAGDFPQAAKSLEDALRIEPNNAEYWQMLGDIKVLEKDYHAAKDYFGKAIDLFPDDPTALASLAMINQRLGEHAVAMQCLNKAAELDPDNPVYAESIAESLFAKKEYSQALDQANRILEKHPQNAKALEIKIRTLIATRHYEEAKQAITTAKTNIQEPIQFEILEIELNAINNKAGGLNASTVLAESHPENPLALNNLAKYYIQFEMHNKAEATLQKSLTLDPSNSETLLLLGKIDREKGNLDQAISHLSRAIQFDPSLIEAYLEMGQTYQERREVNKALETYHKAIDMVAKDPRAYIQAAAAYRDSKDYRNAESMLRQASQISPNDPAIRRQLAALVALNLVNNLQEAPKRR